MPFKKGQSGNPNGREKGSTNMKSRYWKELSTFMTGEGAEKYKKTLMAMEGEEFLKRYESLLQYFKPKLQHTKMAGDTDADPIFLQYVVEKKAKEDY